MSEIRKLGRLLLMELIVLAPPTAIIGVLDTEGGLIGAFKIAYIVSCSFFLGIVASAVYGEVFRRTT